MYGKPSCVRTGVNHDRVSSRRPGMRRDLLCVSPSVHDGSGTSSPLRTHGWPFSRGLGLIPSVASSHAHHQHCHRATMVRSAVRRELACDRADLLPIQVCLPGPRVEAAAQSQWCANPYDLEMGTTRDPFQYHVEQVMSNFT